MGKFRLSCILFSAMSEYTYFLVDKIGLLFLALKLSIWRCCGPATTGLYMATGIRLSIHASDRLAGSLAVHHISNNEPPLAERLIQLAGEAASHRIAAEKRPPILPYTNIKKRPGER